MLLAPIDTKAEEGLSAAGSVVHGMFTLFLFRRILSGKGEIVPGRFERLPEKRVWKNGTDWVIVILC